MLAEGVPKKFGVTIRYSSVDDRIFNETTEIDMAYMEEMVLPGKTTDEQLSEFSCEIPKATDQFFA